MRTALPLRVELERVETAGPWASAYWRAVSVRPDPELKGEDGHHLLLTLHRKETEGYRTNLGSARAVYVILREGRDGTLSEPFRATVCAFEAQDYVDDADSRVDAVPMPDSIAAWLTAFVRRHHMDEPFRKRKRQPAVQPDAFARPPRVRR